MPVAEDELSFQLIPLSYSPVKPCILLRLPGVSLLLDCGLDLRCVHHFIPSPVVSSKRIDSLPYWFPSETTTAASRSFDAGATTAAELDAGIDRGDWAKTCFMECAGKVFVNGRPEFMPPLFSSVDMTSVDVILISNYTCMLALPYVTEIQGFSGTIYATEPTLQIGRLLMEDLVEYVDAVRVDSLDSGWKDSEVVDRLPKALKDSVEGHPQFWRQLYSKQAMERSIERVKLVAYREKMSVFNLARVTAVSSGYCIGSANWLIETHYERLVYMSHCSSLATHPKAIDQVSLQGADALILMGLTQHPKVHPDMMLSEFCNGVIQTVKEGGCVLVPCQPAGVVYDVFEILAGNLDNYGLSGVPIYFLSPVADSSLAFSNIFGEWLSDSKQNKVFMPEEPFLHSALVKTGRLRHFKAIHDGLAAEFKTPCIVFAGHPSLRFGDSVHFMEIWGSDARNTVIFLEPEFCYPEIVAPFQPLAMKALFCPIDTSLNYTQIAKLLDDLAPKRLFAPEAYLNPNTAEALAAASSSATSSRTAAPFDPRSLQIQFDPAIPLSVGATTLMPLDRMVERVKVTPELAAGVGLTAVNGTQMAPLLGVLSAYDNDYSLRPLTLDPPGRRDPTRATPVNQEALRTLFATPYGPLNISGVLKSLKRVGFDAEHDVSAGSIRLKSRKLSGPMTIKLGGDELTELEFDFVGNDQRKRVIDCFLENISKV